MKTLFLLCCYEQKKLIVRVFAMTDEATKQKAMGTVAELYGIDSIVVDLKEQKITVVGEMDPVALTKKLRKLGSAEIITYGPAK
ncbi:hypothetical protein AMTRI_Chr07g78920 [Amborella trichopoda]